MSCSRLPVKQAGYAKLCVEAHNCNLCGQVYHPLTYLNQKNGDINSPIMWIGEAPGFVKNSSERGMAFHGNQSGRNFELLLKHIGLERSEVFVTNALLHTPITTSNKSYDGYGFYSIRSPRINELENCSKFLKTQIDIVDPILIVTIGRQALNAINLIEKHHLGLFDVGYMTKWYNRHLTPIYHTSPNVTASIRTLDQMKLDFENISVMMTKLGFPIRKEQDD